MRPKLARASRSGVFGLAGAGGKKDEARRLSAFRGKDGEHPLLVGRERHARALGEPKRGTAVRASKVDRRPGAGPLALLVQEQHRAVLGEVGGQRAVQPGKVAFHRLSGPEPSNALQGRAVREQDAAVAGDVIELEDSRHANRETELPRQVDPPEGRPFSRFSRREPDLAAVRGPARHTGGLRPACRQDLLRFAEPVDHTDGIRVASHLPKRDQAAIGRKARRAKFAEGEHLPDGRFQPQLVVGDVHHDQVLAIRRPVGAPIGNLIQNLPRGPSRHGNRRENAATDRSQILKDRELPGAGNRQDVPGKREQVRLGALRPSHIEA